MASALTRSSARTSRPASQVERQYRIVKPHATTEEIEEAFDSGAHKPQRGTALST